MKKPKTCTIRLLSKDYDIRCPDTEVDNLQQAAIKLNDYLSQNKKKFRQLDEFKALLLAALNVSHELMSLQREAHEQRDRFIALMNGLEKQISLMKQTLV